MSDPVAPPNPAAPKKEPEPRGLFATLCLLVGLLLLGVAALSALNTAFDLNLALGSYGSSTALPDDWDGVVGIAVGALLIIALTLFGSWVARSFSQAKGKPLHRIGIIVAALALLAVCGCGLQVAALAMTYGSMLAYYCTDHGTLADVEAELADGPDAEALDRCLSRTAQWDRHDLLEPVIKAGGNFKDETRKEEHRRCVLWSDVSVAYVTNAVALGATPTTCPKSKGLIQHKVRMSAVADDAKTAAIVKQLLNGGWSASAKFGSYYETALQLAQQSKLVETAKVLETAKVQDAK